MLRRIGLVGKGICFDTGGVNLKTHRSMYLMHGDMQGSAVAVGTLLAVTRRRMPVAADCWLAITENQIGPRAYRPQDVVRAANGVTIQVVHSDAEGRMVLADTLALAAREKPALLLDFATLTGACVNALTERYSGAFTNRPGLHDDLQPDKWGDGYALSSLIHISKDCPKGHVIHFLASYEIKEWKTIKRNVTWGVFSITIGEPEK